MFLRYVVLTLVIAAVWKLTIDAYLNLAYRVIFLLGGSSGSW